MHVHCACFHTQSFHATPAQWHAKTVVNPNTGEARLRQEFDGHSWALRLPRKLDKHWNSRVQRIYESGLPLGQYSTVMINWWNRSTKVSNGEALLRELFVSNLSHPAAFQLRRVQRAFFDHLGVEKNSPTLPQLCAHPIAVHPIKWRGEWGPLWHALNVRDAQSSDQQLGRWRRKLSVGAGLPRL